LDQRRCRNAGCGGCHSGNRFAAAECRLSLSADARPVSTRSWMENGRFSEAGKQRNLLPSGKARKFVRLWLACTLT
jgi:hypothetical protein